jgi:hypothetical protein
LKAVEKQGLGDKGVRESNGRGWMDQSKVGIHWEAPLNVDLDINNER